MSIIYDVLLQQQNYKPVTGFYGEPKYICIFYDEDRKIALKEMQKYVKQNGFVTPDKKQVVADVGFSGGIWTDYQKAKNQMSISFGFSDTKGIYNFKAWINSSEIRFSFGENPTFEDFKKTAERIFIDEEFCIKTKTPYERTRDKVYATGNRWAKENFDATHN